MELGANIKKYRVKKRMTQEQFAYELGISPQAVSRWENDVTYPDITMLPTIADCFDVSIDELMGRRKECDKSEREEFFKEANKCRESEGIDEAAEMYRRMLKMYPTDTYIQFGLCNLLYILYKSSGDIDLEKEIFSLCNKINQSNKPDMQCGARRILVLMYAQKGEYEKLRRYYKEINNIQRFGNF